MNKRLAAALLLTASAQASAAVITDQFDYTPVGSTLNGKTNGQVTWTMGNTAGAGNDILIASGNLLYANADANYAGIFPTEVGNSVTVDNQAAKVERISTSPFALSSGTLYYSLLLKVNTITGITTGGGFIAGFNNSTGTATSTISQAAARLQIRRSLASATLYNIGIRADVGGTTGTSTLVWDTVDRAVGDTVFVVAGYEFNTATSTDDVARMWLNPSVADLNSENPPATVLQSTGGDISQLQIQSFFLREVASTPRTTQLDELRLSNTWNGATGVPEPSTLGLLALGALPLMRRRK